MTPAPTPRRRRRRARRADRGQRGLTLIELMIAMLISSLLIGMVFSIYTRMSVAYRQQTLVTELQQTLRAAQAVLLRDLRQAGYLIPNGFMTAGNVLVAPLTVTNNADGTGPDALQLFYADWSAQARVLTMPTDDDRVTVDDAAGFDNVARAVIVIPQALNDADPNDGVAPIATFLACMVTNLTAAAGEITYDVAPHCDAVQAAHNDTTPRTMIYPLIGRSYRIDPNRKELSVFQQSPSGGLVANDWSDLGIGFTDFQLASHITVVGDLVDEDGDGDPARDWYSSENQEPTNIDYPAGGVLTHLGVSFAVRTYENVNLVTSAQTPAFIDDTSATTIIHNRRGDAAAELLEGVPDAARPDEHKGKHIYRWSSNVVDMRNLGIGR